MKRNFAVKAMLFAGCAAGALFTSQGAWAQGGSNTELQEIVVTAQKRSEKLEDVPLSITAVTAERLQRSGVQRLEDLPQVAPGLQISRTGFYTQPAIRGITTLTAALPENNVAIYVDGIYIRSSRAVNFDLANVASVQVLKGPQGTLFGRNATGGAILVQTVEPSLSEVSGRLSATYARFDDKRAQGYISAPISDVLAVLLTGSYRDSRSYLRDVAGFDTAPLKSYTLGLKTRLELGENVSVTAKADTLYLNDGRGNAPTVLGRSKAQFDFPGSYSETRKNRTSYDHPVETQCISTPVRSRSRTGWVGLPSPRLAATSSNGDSYLPNPRGRHGRSSRTTYTSATRPFSKNST